MHNSLLTFKILEDNGETGIGGAHSHILEDFQAMTVTDICTLMLNQHLTKWKYYATVSKKYLSFWDYEKNELRIIENNDENFKELEKMMTESKK